ncbi:hypothetical protein JOF56_001339 [Kibdelosporangium banguiense]|uniref:Excreted virulence factor EspC, type VII ESX diderm n=1 Tax=Kibdelosporangium banguiense TaxID=1365924 RepID=A0ABS4T972_9PSEU|nr:hypothetical protein [Kibdelosporangium banguiense]MBP2320954.1 hypothetical protein [Kibdelosporangium banguiense]
MKIDDGGGKAASGSIMTSMIEFAKLAAQGGFEISREGGDHLLKAIDGFQDWINDQSDRIRLLEQDRKLGTSNAAKVIGPFAQQVANDDQGFITQLFALRDSLHKAREGIQLAMDQYERTEEATRGNLKNIST